jgi:hypothetical protein
LVAATGAGRADGRAAAPGARRNASAMGEKVALKPFFYAGLEMVYHLGMATQTLIPAKEFERLARENCSRWGDHFVAAVRALLVDGRDLPDVAIEFAISPQHVYELRRRFLARRDNPVKVPAKVFMDSVSPDRSPLLVPFRAEVMKLIKKGYSTPQVLEFLRMNDVTVTSRELTRFLKGRA